LVTGRPNGSMATKVFSRPGDTSQSAPKFCAGEGGTRDVRDVPREISMESCSKTIQKPYKNPWKTQKIHMIWLVFFAEWCILCVYNRNTLVNQDRLLAYSWSIWGFILQQTENMENHGETSCQKLSTCMVFFHNVL
jgi:hypothetical protein